MGSEMFKPMLASDCKGDLASIVYPVLASPKLDGIRCIVRDGRALSRSLKPIPNEYIRASLEHPAFEGFDGELMLRDTAATFQAVTSAVMKRDGAPAFVFNTFDHHDADNPKRPFAMRYTSLVSRLKYAASITELHQHVDVVPHIVVPDAASLAAFEAEQLALGYEGVMVRAPGGPYKYGRSTVREGFLLKVKRFEDAEAIVVGFEERMHNTNEATTNELGRTKRSSAQEGKVPMGTLGAFVLERPDGVRFNCGTGLDDALRAEVWAQRAAWLGATVKYKHQPHGAKDAPRLPVFLGRRDGSDL